MRLLLPVIAILGVVLSALIGISYLQPLQGADVGGCAMLYMNPAYSRVTGFDDSHTKFAKKYLIYLYREEDIDPMPANDDDGFVELTGVPLLFIPGNAGSYRQVRSIASETATTYFHQFKDDANSANINASNFDIFTADFNEDFTAFHGRTMLDQAEYLNDAIKFILDLYSQNENPPTSVVVLGHLMGGVVARTMMTLPNYVPDSVNTIITLALPHAASPLTFDGDLIRLYLSVDRFWYDGYNLPKLIAHSRLANVSLISITGGLLDDTLPADYTTLGYLVPPTNGFTTHTTGISEVWSPIDHLAIVWCNQLRTKLAQVLLNIIDVNVGQRTYPLQKRMRIFRRHLLSGFELYAMQDKLAYSSVEPFTLKRDKLDTVTSLEIGPGHRDNEGKKQVVTVFDVSNQTDFGFISSVPPTAWSEFVSTGYINPLILLCRYSKEKSTPIYDLLLSRSAKTVTQQCIDVSLDFNVVPHPGVPLFESSYSGGAVPYYGFEYNQTTLQHWDEVVVVDRLINNDDDTVLVAQSYPSQPLYVIGGSMWSLLFGASVTLPQLRPMMVDIAIPGAWSLILAYSVKLRPQLRNHLELPLFQPMVRQWSDEPFESKWHMEGELDHLIITKHGIAPYTPFKVSSDPTHWGINLQIWQLASTPLDISCHIDWMASLKLLVLRYRLAVVALCVLITLLVMAIQIRMYQLSQKWPDFIQAMSQLTSLPSLLIIFTVLVVLTPVTKVRFVQEFLDVIDPVVIRDPNDINILLRRDYLLNSFYLGLEETMLWLLGPIFFCIGIGLVYVSAYLIIGIVAIIRKVGRRFIHLQVRDEDGGATKREEPQEDVNIDWYKWVWQSRRMIAMAVVVMLVPIYVPYPAVYVTCVMLQILKVGHYSVTQLVSNLNFHITLLVLFLWVLPINIPILVVFVHNVAVNWTTPFASHHNLLSILPILVVTRLQGIPKFGNNRYTKVCLGYIYYCVGYCVVYGVRHTFWIHHLVNLLCCLLILGYFM